MAQSKSTDILLVGKTGSGKSTTANTIVGYKAFKCEPSFESVTKTVQFEYGEFEGRVLKVVDGPGVADTSLNEEKSARLVADAMSFAVAANPRGYHAILLVLPFGSRYTKEDVDSVRILRDIFGPNFITNHGILLMSNGEKYDTEELGEFEHWISRQGGEIRDVITECGGRVILFDNRSKDPVVKLNQVRKLLCMIDQLAVEGARYTSAIFEKANESRERLIQSSKKQQLSEESLIECGLITQKLATVDYNKPEAALRRTTTLKPRTEQLLQMITAEDMGYNNLGSSIALAKQLDLSVEEQMAVARQYLRLKQLKGILKLEGGLKQTCLTEEKEEEETEEEDTRKYTARKATTQLEYSERKQRKKGEMEEELERQKCREQDMEEELRRQKKKQKELKEKLERQKKKEMEREKHEMQQQKDKELKEERERRKTELELQRRKLELENEDRLAKLREQYQTVKQDEGSWTLGTVAGAVATTAVGLVKWWWGM